MNVYEVTEGRGLEFARKDPKGALTGEGGFRSIRSFGASEAASSKVPPSWKLGAGVLI